MTTTQIDFDSPPDFGITKALGLNDLPLNGQCVELGSGTARNLMAIARKFPNKCIGIELDTDWIELANEKIKSSGLQAQVVFQDANEISYEPESLSIVAVGTVIYLPKSGVTELFNKIWRWLKPNGVLHAEFPTLDDGTKDSDFVRYTCLPYPESSFPNSYGHYCGYNCMADHPGVCGVSYWEPQEVYKFVKAFSKAKVIHADDHEWLQNMGPNEPKLKRSFHIITVQKDS